MNEHRVLSKSSMQSVEGAVSGLQFIAPGPGCWELEAAHHSRPITLFVRDLVPDAMAAGFSEGTAIYGLLLSHLRSAFVNGFWYCKKVYAGIAEDAQEPLPANLFEQASIKKRMEDCLRAFDARAWIQDLKAWDEQVKPDSIRRNKILQSVDVSQLDDAALAQHIQHCADNLHEMIRRHHRFTPSAMVPVGHFLANASAWTGANASRLIALLRGASPISRGPLRELTRLATEIQKAKLQKYVFEIHSADKVISKLHTTNGVREALQGYLEIVGNSVVSGYDVSSPAGTEVPNILLGAIQSAVKGILSSDEGLNARQAEAAAILEQAPSSQRSDLQRMLDDAWTMFRLREERTVYTDQWALGIARRALLEAGRRLVAKGDIARPEDLIEASVRESIHLLTRQRGPSSDDLQARARYRLNHTVEDAPAWLGVSPSEPPPLESIPEAGRPGVIAMGVAMSEIFEFCDGKPLPSAVSGFAASSGIYVGHVRLIDSERDFIRLRPGDVIVTKVASAAFSVVMPMAGALVTDRGGRLSHPAIIAREYGVPSVVGTRQATRIFHDDDLVRVDGTSGTVEKIN